MANTSVTSVGRVNNTSATPLALGTAYDTKYATYLKLFSGEMFKAYESATIAKGTVQSRTLKNGKAMQFIFTGRMEAAWTGRAYTQGCVYDNRVNSGKPKAKAMAILSQANQAGLEGATTTWGDTILSRNTWLAPDNSMSGGYSLNCTKV